MTQPSNFMSTTKLDESSVALFAEQVGYDQFTETLVEFIQRNANPQSSVLSPYSKGWTRAAQKWLNVVKNGQPVPSEATVVLNSEPETPNVIQEAPVEPTEPQITAQLDAPSEALTVPPPIDTNTPAIEVQSIREAINQHNIIRAP